MLVVDDSVVVRRVLTDLLNSDPDIEVCGSAANGRLALQKLNQVNPDLVMLDIEMPELDGIGTLRELRKTNRRLPVIMCSTLTERGASATLEALSAGASDYVTKPTNSSSITESVDRLRQELVPKIKHLARPSSATQEPLPPLGRRSGAAPAAPEPSPRRFSGVPPQRQAPPTTVVRPSGPAPRPDVLAIGVSTGGPNALAELIPALPGAMPVPVLIVQHMPATFTRLLAERLDRVSHLRVVEATAGMPVQPGTCYIAPGDHHLVVRRSGTSVLCELNQEPPENSCRPAVDVLFRSVAEVYGANVLAAVMTGMGQDGLRGAQVLVERGARVLAQDEASSVVWGMPGYVARAGLADAVLPLGALAAEITKRVSRSGAPLAPATAGGVLR